MRGFHTWPYMATIRFTVQGLYTIFNQILFRSSSKTAKHFRGTGKRRLHSAVNPCHDMQVTFVPYYKLPLYRNADRDILDIFSLK